jgi:hypothetical protein
LLRAVPALDAANSHQNAESAALLAKARQCCGGIGLRSFAKLASIDAGNLSRILTGKLEMSRLVATKIARAVALAILRL